MKAIIDKVQGKSKKINIESSKRNYFVSVDDRLVYFARASIESEYSEYQLSGKSLSQKNKPNK